MGRREINVEIFQDTTEFLNESEKLLTATAETRRKQKLILADQEIPKSGSHYEQAANVIV